LVRLFDQLVVLVAALLLVALGVAGCLIGFFGWDPVPLAQAGGRYLAGHRIAALVGGLCVLAGGMYLAYQILAPAKDRGIVSQTELGQVQIQYRAIENLVVRTAQEIKGVRDVEAAITATGEGVQIALSCNVLPDVSIPALCDQVQQRVAQAVRETVGVEVASVTVDVRNVLAPVKGRVE